MKSSHDRSLVPRKILIVTDLSHRSRIAVENGLDLARRFGSELVVLHLFSAATAENEKQLPHPTATDFGRIEDAFDQVREAARACGLACECIVAEGAGPEQITDIITAKAIELVLVGKSAVDCFPAVMYDSLTRSFFEQTACPVLTIGPRIPAGRQLSGRGGPVVFATDLDEHRLTALQHAGRFAEMFHTQLHCLHILPRILEEGQHSATLPSFMEKALGQLTEGADLNVDDIVYAARFGAEVSTAIVAYAEQQNARLLVLRAEERSSAFPANIPYRVLCEASCPLLTVPGNELWSSGTVSNERKTGVSGSIALERR